MAFAQNTLSKTKNYLKFTSLSKMTSIPASFIWEYSHPRGSMAKWLTPGAGFELSRPGYKSRSGHKEELFLVAIQVLVAGWGLSYGGIFLYAQTWMITLWIIGLALHPENSKKDQNLHFLPLSETNSITVTFTWEGSPELSSSDMLVNSLMLCLQPAEILTCFLSVSFSVPFCKPQCSIILGHQ